MTTDGSVRFQSPKKSTSTAEMRRKAVVRDSAFEGQMRVIASHSACHGDVAQQAAVRLSPNNAMTLVGRRSIETDHTARRDAQGDRRASR